MVEALAPVEHRLLLPLPVVDLVVVELPVQLGQVQLLALTPTIRALTTSRIQVPARLARPTVKVRLVAEVVPEALQRTRMAAHHSLDSALRLQVVELRFLAVLSVAVTSAATGLQPVTQQTRPPEQV
jgi:hypothetical protein